MSKCSEAMKRGYEAAEARWEQCGRDLDSFTVDLLPGVPRPLEGEQLEQWLSAFEGVPTKDHQDHDEYVSGLGMGGVDVISRELNRLDDLRPAA